MLGTENFDKVDEATELLDTVRNDTEENFTLLDKGMIRELTAWHIKALCRRSQTKKP